MLTKEEPLSVTYGFGADIHRHEGRVITAEYPDFYLVCCYTPNSQDAEAAPLPDAVGGRSAGVSSGAGREKARGVLRRSERGPSGDGPEKSQDQPPKPRLLRPGAGENDPAAGKRLCRHLPHLHPEEVTYSWWSYRFHAREKNAGWRIDYFIVSRRLLPRVTDAAIRTEVYGSDHCPVVLQLDTSSGQA